MTDTVENQGNGCNAAILYHPDGYVTNRKKLMGRHAAGEGFLRGFARHTRNDTLYAFTENKKHFQQFVQQVKPHAGGKQLAWVPEEQPEELARPGALYLPGPGLGEYAWQRRYRDPATWSITGVTHTICTDRVMDSLGELLTAPVQEWDAVICTSDAVKKGAINVMQGYAEYLAQRFGCEPPQPRIQLPVIPLGVDCDALTGQGRREEMRTKLREQHGIGDDEVVVLFFGRLSYHAKAHPLPMYLALEAASRTVGRKLHLIQAGWFANDAIQRGFIDGARSVCPNVNCIFVDGRLPEIREHIWGIADIFCSLSDNVQETFGLTPVEAMAAGLPVVASDWNGYRGTVEHGVTGFLVPTVMPAPGYGENLAYRYLTRADTYDVYIGKTSMSISVDVPATVAALTELIINPDLRKRMGEAGQDRARRIFDWPVIVAAYESLWGELADRRRSAPQAEGGSTGLPSPLRDDPYRVFGHYSTATLGPDTRLQVALPNPFKAFTSLAALGMNNYVRGSFASNAEIKRLLRELRKHEEGQTVAGMLQDIGADEQALYVRTLGWLAKLGIVRISHTTS